MATRNVAAVDLGAASGRVLLVRFDGRALSLQEVHRFSNRAVLLHGHRFWNVLALWDEILSGLRKARQLAGSLDSIGVDTWGIDYGLVDVHGMLLGLPFQYRDARTDGVMEQVAAQLSRDVVYQRTGIQFLPFNTLYQLYAHHQMQPEALAQAYRLLLMPDLFHNWLCGSLTSERTNATTTQCWNPTTGTWATDLFEQLAIPVSVLPTVVEAGTVLGEVLPWLRDELGIARVITPATHDTGSAVAAIPAQQGRNWGYISSGTWSLVGVELTQPLMTVQAMAANFTNEGGVFGTTRFLKNVMGLWLLQECQRNFAEMGNNVQLGTLLAGIESVPAFASLIDPDDPRFLAPHDMPAAINSYLREHGQQMLQTPTAFARCIMESLVLRYCEVFQQISELTETDLDSVHVVGGGARNSWLNQWLADALAVPVLAGPFEATGYGNALMQLVGLGELHGLADVRSVAQKETTRLFSPRMPEYAAWQEAMQRFKMMNAAK